MGLAATLLDPLHIVRGLGSVMDEPPEPEPINWQRVALWVVGLGLAAVVVFRLVRHLRRKKG